MYEDFFKERLSELRLDKGVSARDMSLTLGQSESYINRIENGQMLPSMNMFFYICDYFKITPEQFFAGSKTKQVSIDIVEIMMNLQRLDQKKRDHIAAVISDLI